MANSMLFYYLQQLLKINNYQVMQQHVGNESIFTLKQIDLSNDSPRRQSLNLPDFQVSQVIATNQLIDIRCEEERPFDNFFLRINQLGYETNHITNQTILVGQNDSGKYSSNEQNFNFQKVQQKRMKTAKKKKAKRQLLKRIQTVGEQLFQLDCQKVSLVHEIDKMRQNMHLQLSKHADSWAQLRATWQEQVQRIVNQQRLAKLRLAQENEDLLNRIEELQRMKQHSNIEQNRCTSKMDEMQEQINKLNAHIHNLETQNEQLKYQLHRLHQNQQKIRNLEQQIGNLTKNLEQNSQYIFDLQQKISSANFDLTQRQYQIKKQYEQTMLHLKQKIEKDYTLQFQKIQEEIKAKAIEQAYQEYQTYHQQIDELKRQLEAQSEFIKQQKNQYQTKILLLEKDKLKLVQENRNYQAKLHEMEHIQMVRSRPRQEDKIKIEELATKLKNIEDKYRDKEVQLNYYKSLKNKPQTSNRLDTALDQTIIQKPILKECAISPSSGAIIHKYKPREELINNILSRIKLRQQGSNVSQLLQNSIQSSQMKKTLPSTLRPISPQSILLEKEKDVRMRNISSKLEQLRSDIRRQIGMMKN